jgi:DNA-binding transcriptional MerR regulator
MKSGRASKIFGIDQKTIYKWTDDFAEFFSRDAQGIGRTQREYSPEDMIVMNTIMKLRAQRVEVEEIRARLASGERDTVLPPEATAMPGENAIMVYAQLRQLETMVAERDAMIAMIESKNEKIIEEYKQQITDLRSENSGHISELNRQINELNREIGRYQAKLDFLREQLDERKSDDDE